MTERNVFTAEDELPPEHQDQGGESAAPPAPPTPTPEADPSFRFDAETAIAWGKLFDSGLGAIKDPAVQQGIRFYLDLFKNRNSPPEPAPTNGQRPPVTESERLMQPVVDVEKVMVEIEKALALVVQVKGADKIETIPPLLQSNRTSIKKQIQAAVVRCVEWQEAPNGDQSGPGEQGDGSGGDQGIG